MFNTTTVGDYTRPQKQAAHNTPSVGPHIIEYKYCTPHTHTHTHTNTFSTPRMFFSHDWERGRREKKEWDVE